MPPTSTATISSPSSATIPCSGRTQRNVPSPQRIDLGHGKSPTIRPIASPITSAALRPGRSMTANSTPSRSSSCSRVEPGLAQEPVERLGGRRCFRPLDLLAARGGLPGQPARDQRQPPRRRVNVDRARFEPRFVELLGEHPRQIVARPRLHPRRNLLATAIRAGKSAIRPPAPSSPSRSRRRRWRGRGRGRYRPGARRPRSRRAPAAC